MCIVSAVSDHYMGRWPMTGPSISWEEYAEYQRLKKMAEELDAKTGQPDCVKPEVEVWEKAMEEFLKKKGLLS